MKTKRKEERDGYMSLTIPASVVRTNRRQSKTERYRTRSGLPTLSDIATATQVLSRLQTTNGVMELSKPENLDLLRWAHSTVNYKE
jgi:hypothetical protein